MNKPIVSLSKNENLEIAVRDSLDQLSLPDLNNKTVLLKPNVGRETDPRIAVNTNPDVVAAIFHYLTKKFDAEFLIGDSPIINTDSRGAFEQSGYGPLLKKKGLRYLDLNEPEPIELPIQKGTILKKIKVTGYWNEIDAIISIPVLKFHMHCGATLSFKNLKGLIYRREKIKLHHFHKPKILRQVEKEFFQDYESQVKELDIAISDLAYVFKPALAIIDASYALEGMGPSAGNAVKLDTIIASRNYLAADITALAINQPDWTLTNVPHLKIISESLPNQPKTIDEIETIPENISPYQRTLKPPPTSITIKHENVHLIAENACSACLSTIFNLVENNKDFINKHFTKEKPLNFAIGKGIKEFDLYEDTYLVGNCTYEHRDRGTFIKGCTPVESTIMRVIKENLGLKNKE
ncbi:MAG: DUF362 domain-containing protein [Promethearchaeia archaeon]